MLLVEDDPFVRMVTADYFREAGFLVIEALDAAEAIQVMSQTEIDVVFTDIRMPGEMSGSHLAIWINERHKGLPVLITSGVFAGTRYPLAKNFFPKPYRLDAVHKRVLEVLDEA
jgi:DNA-binding NtrC family response regulator